ncbi:MAG: Uma2 family endonuclease [Isosphaeraceae bacterium]|nr:Uma2 family endonuclease [Isosphaeraceae bacterium]
MPEATLSPPTVRPPADDDALYEIVRGRRVELPPTGAIETVLATMLTRLIGPYLDANPLGRLAGETLFLIDPVADIQRRPDLAFVSYQRWPREQRLPPTNAWGVVPDLVVEVVSPSSAAVEVLDKLQEYFRAGVRLVWVVYPVQEQFYVYDSPISVRVLQRADVLDGGAVLPDLRLPLAKLFEVG